MTDLKELRDLHKARSRFYDPLTASSFEVACIEALPALLDVAEAAEAHVNANVCENAEINDPPCGLCTFCVTAATLARLTEGK